MATRVDLAEHDLVKMLVQGGYLFMCWMKLAASHLRPHTEGAKLYASQPIYCFSGEPLDVCMQ